MQELQRTVQQLKKVQEERDALAAKLAAATESSDAATKANSASAEKATRGSVSGALLGMLVGSRRTPASQEGGVSAKDHDRVKDDNAKLTENLAKVKAELEQTKVELEKVSSDMIFSSHRKRTCSVSRPFPYWCAKDQGCSFEFSSTMCKHLAPSVSMHQHLSVLPLAISRPGRRARHV